MLRAQLFFRLRLLGWQGICGLVLVVAALVWAVSIGLLSGARLDQIDRQLALVTAKLKQGQQTPAAQKPTTATEQLLAFYREFPDHASTPDWLGKIYVLAEQHQLALNVGEYSLTQAQAGRLDMFTITLPVKGTYPQVRKFIRAALLTAPALALEGLDLKRDKVGDGSVEARIVFRLYLEKGS
ncbi:MAG TPA: hypothetical protein PLB25_01980 [Rhodoferax sp.]|nr:hypothetical protein [Rhodoferax sp.]